MSYPVARFLGVTPALDVTAPTAPLAEAATRMSRLLPARSVQPAHAAVLLHADEAGVLLVATDGELTVRVRVPTTTHEPGEAVVSRRRLADTLAALNEPHVRLLADGAHLAVRVPGARFALPQLGGTRPTPARLPRAVGTIAGAHLRAAAVPVAGAASREHALPVFTGVRLRSHDERLWLLATDRYRLASASVPWQPASGSAGPAGTVASAASDAVAGPLVDALVPAAAFAEAAKQAGRADRVVVHADRDLFGLAWDGGSVVTATLGTPFPDAQLDRLLSVIPDCVIEVEADALAGAVDRASRYADVHGRVVVQAIDGAVLVRASDARGGESEETVKATLRGAHVTRIYQARLLADALRAAARHTVEMRVQAGIRPTEFAVTAGEQPATHLRYLVVPMRPPSSEDAR
jgi:DNA polymerase-3 subunit beta